MEPTIFSIIVTSVLGIGCFTGLIAICCCDYRINTVTPLAAASLVTYSVKEYLPAYQEIPPLIPSEPPPPNYEK